MQVVRCHDGPADRVVASKVLVRRWDIDQLRELWLHSLIHRPDASMDSVHELRALGDVPSGRRDATAEVVRH